MNRRPNVLAASAMAAALVLAPGLSPLRAAGIVGGLANYRLTSSADIPTASSGDSGPQVVARVVPPGSVVPAKQTDGSEASPLTILKSSTGFDPAQLIVALKDNLANPAGTPEQLFGLSFFGNGFSKGGQLDFSLSLDKALTTPPALESLTPGISIVALQTADPKTTTTTTTTTSTATAAAAAVVQTQGPEPMSVVLWSAIGGALALRARKVRRRVAA